MLLEHGQGRLGEVAQRACLLALGESSEQGDGLIVRRRLDIDVGGVEALAGQALELVQPRLLHFRDRCRRGDPIGFGSGAHLLGGGGMVRDHLFRERAHIAVLRRADRELARLDLEPVGGRSPVSEGLEILAPGSRTQEDACKEGAASDQSLCVH